MFHGIMDECCGITTVSGTESITTAMISYRNRGYTLGITKPEMYILIYIINNKKV